VTHEKGSGANTIRFKPHLYKGLRGLKKREGKGPFLFRRQPGNGELLAILDWKKS